MADWARERPGARRAARSPPRIAEARAGRGGYPRPRDPAVRRALAGRRPPRRAARCRCPGSATSRTSRRPSEVRRGDRRATCAMSAELLDLAVARRAGRRRPAAGAGRRAGQRRRVQDQPHRPRQRHRPRRRGADRRDDPRPSGPATRSWARRAPTRRGSGEVRWLVDPLDGTINYLWGIPQWSVSVAALDADGPLVGVVHDPSRGETFTARPRRRGARSATAPLRRRARRRRSTRRSSAPASATSPPSARRQAAACCRRSCRRCATCAASARRRSTSPGWRAAGSTATSSAASTPGTGRRDG